MGYREVSVAFDMASRADGVSVRELAVALRLTPRGARYLLVGLEDAGLLRSWRRPHKGSARDAARAVWYATR